TSQRQWATKRPTSAPSLASKGVRTGASTPRSRMFMAAILGPASGSARHPPDHLRGAQEVEVGALVGLGYGLQEELHVAALGARRRHRRGGGAARQLLVGEGDGDRSRGDTEADAVAASHPGERPAD